MKTIKQIADELGVSKTAVRKQIANLGLQSSLQKNGNQFLIDDKQESLIIKAFKKKTQTESENQTQTETKTDSVLVSMLQNELDIKNEQIRELNARLAETTAALVTAQQTVQAAQALHAGTIRQQIENGVLDPAAPDETPPKKHGFFARVFRKDNK